jgi:phosphoribosylformylglycinamidine (FGAM) synthase-like enzyme
LTTHDARLTTHELLFSESHGRAVITCSPERVPAIQALAGELGVPLLRAGTVGSQDGAFRIALRDGQIEEPVSRLRDVYFTAIPRRMGD